MPIAEIAFFIAAALIFFPLERLLPLHPGQKWPRPHFATDVLHIVMSGLLIRLGGLATVILLSKAALAIIPGGIPEVIRSQPVWLQFVQLFVLSDFCFYVAHRIVHAVPWLWRFHAVHHSSERLDWIATYRVHPVDQVFNSAVIALPGLMLGFSPGALIAYALLYRWHAMLLHSNVRVPAGPIARLIATPVFHHWHHADERHAYDRNFGGQLVIWDRLFGTYHRQPRLPLRYGVGGEVPDDYVGQLLVPFGIRSKCSRSETEPNSAAPAMQRIENIEALP